MNTAVLIIWLASVIVLPFIPGVILKAARYLPAMGRKRTVVPCRPRYRVDRHIRRALQDDDLFAFGGRKYRLGLRDQASFEFLMGLERWRDATTAPEPLVRFRDAFRRLIQDRPVNGLARCLRDGDHPTRRLAIWLLGRSGDTTGTPLVAYYLRREDRKLRIAVARALVRLHARAELEQMAEDDGDSWIRDYASRHSQRSFQRQLASFVPEQEAGREPTAARPRSKMPLVINVASFDWRPPKSAQAIRAILERIRNLLHGPTRAGNGR